MKDIENYEILLRKIFKKDFQGIDTKKDVTNNIIRALNEKKDFFVFISNFKHRLSRLYAIYKNSPKNLKVIIERSIEIASKNNWQGAYAELVAYDYLNSCKDLLANPISLDCTLKNDESYAIEMGQKQDSNLDCYVPDLNIYFDIKSLKDNNTEIFNRIVKNISTFYGLKNLHILKEYDNDNLYFELQSHFCDLYNELKKVIWGVLESAVEQCQPETNAKVIPENFKMIMKKASVEQKKKVVHYIQSSKTKHFKSKCIKGLSYVIGFDRGIYYTESTYSPYKHAKDFSGSIFKYANKFLKKKPSILIFVTTPWYNNIITSLCESNKEFYRACARRFFIQYKDVTYDKTKKNFIPDFNGEDSLYQISSHLSGIIFIEDNSKDEKRYNKTNLSSYIYLNPNSSNNLNIVSIDYLHSLDAKVFDNFKYDNY